MVQKDSKIVIYTCSDGFIAIQEQVPVNDVMHDQPYINKMLEFGTLVYKCTSFVGLNTLSDFKENKKLGVSASFRETLNFPGKIF